MFYERVDYNDACKYSGQRLLGRVGAYFIKEGYGFLHTELGKDIFLSSYALNDLERKIALGTVLSFKISILKDKVMASDILIEDNSHFNDTVFITNEVSFKLKKLEIIDLRPGERILCQVGEREKQHILSHHDVSVLNHIYLKERYGREHMYFSRGCPYSRASGYIDNLDDFYKDIENRYFKI